MLLVEQQEGHPVCKKTEWWGAGVVICLQRGADLHMAQLTPLPFTVSCFSKSTLGFYTFLVLAHLGSPENGPLNMRVCLTYRWSDSSARSQLAEFCSDYSTQKNNNPTVGF